MEDKNPWRTLISGTLQQTTPLSVSGSEPGDTSVCYRDGKGRLVLTGTTLGGLLVESAARVCPSVVDDMDLGYAVTGKLREPGQAIGDEFLRRSVWAPFSSYLLDPENVQTFWQQGVGINQKTRAAAANLNALYEQECVPTGSKWSFFLDIDTASSPKSRELAIVTLIQWMEGWAPLGRAPTRGNGFFELVDAKIYDLHDDHIDLWPNNKFDPSLAADRNDLNEHFTQVGPVALTGCIVADAVKKVKQVEQVESDRANPWLFARFQFEAIFGEGTVAPNNEEYGLEALCVSGHESLLFDDTDVASQPEFVSAVQPNSPFSVTRIEDGWKPAIGGGGIRGPVRHAASALARGANPNDTIPDPNESNHRDQMVQALSDDPITQLFGWLNLSDMPEQDSSRCFVWESVVEGSRDVEWLVVRSEHHAEDEFTAGTFASAKYNRDTMLRGTFKFTFQLESSTESELLAMLQTLKPALELAKLGFVGLGGCKGVAGYTTWEFFPETVQASNALGESVDAVKQAVMEAFGDQENV